MGKPEIAIEQNTQEKIPQEKVIPITDPEGGGGDSSNEINRRPFVLERKSGGGRGNMPPMLVAIGVILVFGVGMIAFLSTKGTTKHKTATEAAKPNLGRFGAPTAPGDLVPSDKMNHLLQKRRKAAASTLPTLNVRSRRKPHPRSPRCEQAQRAISLWTKSQNFRNRIRVLATRSGPLLPMAATT